MYQWKKLGIAWIAMLAMLAALFAPSVPVALAAAPEIPITWEEICSQAHSTDSAHFSGQPSTADHDAHFNHCPFCTKQSHAIDLLPAASTQFAKAENLPTFTATRDEPLSPRVSWVLHPSRAPPAHA